MRKTMNSSNRPLADLMRPLTIDDILGQSTLLSENGLIRRMVENKHLSNLLLWGPPGCGKTTIARALANSVDMEFVPMSAVFSGIADIKKAMETAKMNCEIGRQTLLFIDEIHRFNKTQQDTLLPYLEDGTVVFIGATTENPSFNLNNALLSRCHIGVLQPLSTEDLLVLLERAEKFLGSKKIPLTPESKIHLAQMADGDARFLLNTVEYLVSANFDNELSTDELNNAIQKRAPLSDKSGDEHYNLISAVHKSLRASDTDAALYWTARMMTSGQDPMYLFRRLTRFAMEDIGLADPNAMQIALSAWQIYERMGSPEGDLALTQLVIYLGTAPKSIGNYNAQKSAWTSARATGSLIPPKNILNAPTKMMKNLGYGSGYFYEPETNSGFSGQNCFPENLPRQNFYTPREIGFEREIKKRVDYWNKLRTEKK
ncbi:MAG: replication-associated recombination protein A [Alphaproteobacteria bacterium]|nr:replication-associated recombination protein A [Alphaproteobacteria bacterium]MBN2675574.1 replication-associated recombination protein A [Alphaproteobacteria bacterium]